MEHVEGRAHGGEARPNLADLRKTNLREANLRETDLREANLRGANLRGTLLRVGEGYVQPSTNDMRTPEMGKSDGCGQWLVSKTHSAWSRTCRGW